MFWRSDFGISTDSPSAIFLGEQKAFSRGNMTRKGWEQQKSISDVSSNYLCWWSPLYILLTFTYFCWLNLKPPFFVDGSRSITTTPSEPNLTRLRRVSMPCWPWQWHQALGDKLSCTRCRSESKVPSGYVKIAIEHGHRNSWFSH